MNEKPIKTDFVGLRVDSEIMKKLLREKQRIEDDLQKVVSVSYVIREILNRLP